MSQKIEVYMNEVAETYVENRYPMVYYCINQLSSIINGKTYISKEGLDLTINCESIFNRYDNVEISVYNEFTVFIITKDSYMFECEEIVINHNDFNKFSIKVW